MSEDKERDDAFDEAFADEPQKGASNAETAAEEPDKEPPSDEKKEAAPKDGEKGEEDADAASEKKPDEQRADTPQKKEERVDPEQFKGYLDEREKRQKAEAEAERLKSQLAQFQQKKTEPEKVPDLYENPEAYQTHIQQQFENQLLNQRLDMSEAMAEQQFGGEAVSAAKEWAIQQMSTVPGFRDSLLQNRHPYGEAVRLYRQHQISTEVGDDVDAFKKRVIEEYLTQNKQQPSAPQQQANPDGKPPASQTQLPPNVAGSGGTEAVKPPSQTENDFFESVFTR